MKAKKVLTAVLSAAMVFSVLPVTSAKAEEIDGSTIFVDQEVIDVTLPTTASQKFYVDPQGLIAIGKATDPTTAAAANQGTVVGASDMYAVNRSSIPLALSVSYQLKDSVTTGGVTVVTSFADNDAITALQNDATQKIAVSVSAVESATDAATGGNACGGHVFKANASAGVDITGTSGMTTADAVYANATTPTTADYLMTAETYVAKLKAGKTAADAYDSSAYEYVVKADAHKASCVKLTIGGYCSTKADWSDYADGTKTLKLDVVFKFKKLTTTTGDYSDAKVGTDEVQTGPKVTMTPTGLITISGLTAAKNVTGYGNVKLSNGTDTFALQASTSTFTAGTWTADNGGTCTFQLGSAWKTWNDDSVTATVTLTDGSTINCGSVTLSIG